MLMKQLTGGTVGSNGVTLTGEEYINFRTVVGDHKGMVVTIYRGSKGTLTLNGQTVTEIKDNVTGSAHMTVFALTDIKDGDTLAAAGSLVYGVYVD